MDTYIDTLYKDIIEFCKAASQTLGQTHPNSLPISPTSSIPAEIQASQTSVTESSDFAQSEDNSEADQTLEDEEDLTQVRSDSPSAMGWSEKEDQVLLEVITNYKKNWDKIKLRIFKLTKMRKTVGFLRKRYADIVSSTREKKNSKYTHSEDLRIAHGIMIHGFDWIKIAGDFPDRDSRSIKNRYYYHISKKNLMESLTNELSNLEWSQFKSLDEE